MTSNIYQDVLVGKRNERRDISDAVLIGGWPGAVAEYFVSTGRSYWAVLHILSTVVERVQ